MRASSTSNGQEEKRRKLNAALATDTSALPVAEALATFGLVADLATDLGDIAALKHALDTSGALLERLTAPKDIAEFDYFLGTAWDDLRELRRRADGAAWFWAQPELARANRAYRSALTGDGFESLHTYRQCQVLTNIGNHFDHLGRFVEALEYWDQALALDPAFGMAIGNRGMGLYNYARHLYDRGHAAVFLGAARVALTDAVERPLEGDAIEFFRGLLSRIEHHLESGASHATTPFEEYSLGRSSEEQTYRRSCLRHRCFLNPLNDLGSQSIGARDILTTPPMTVAIAEGPQFHGFFNQMKQEFISARYLHFEGTQDAHGSHFSDRDALLYDTLDYPVYGLATEQLKMAFRMAFSVLDKIAYFLNAYLRLGIPESRVAFRTLWFTNQQTKDGLRPEFADRKNLPLRGLYWLSRDLAEPADPSEDLRDCLEPEARALADIRNHLEHKYLKIHSLGFADGGRADPGRPLADTLSYSINRIAFEKKCLKMIKLARAAIMYLSFAIHHEERERAAIRKSKGVKTGSIRLLHFPDEWKR